MACCLMTDSVKPVGPQSMTDEKVGGPVKQGVQRTTTPLSP